jgi:hypothetical protein
MPIFAGIAFKKLTRGFRRSRRNHLSKSRCSTGLLWSSDVLMEGDERVTKSFNLVGKLARTVAPVNLVSIAANIHKGEAAAMSAILDWPIAVAWPYSQPAPWIQAKLNGRTDILFEIRKDAL